MRVELVNGTGKAKKVKIGWSWTTFLFSAFAPLFRGDIKWAVIMFMVNLVVAFTTSGFGVFIPIILFPAFYNKFYAKDLIAKGYAAQNEADKAIINKYINK